MAMGLLGYNLMQQIRNVYNIKIMMSVGIIHLGSYFIMRNKALPFRAVDIRRSTEITQVIEGKQLLVVSRCISFIMVV